MNPEYRDAEHEYEIQLPKPGWLRILRRLLLLLSVGLGLVFLNDAVFSGWVAGGPPGDHELGWGRRSLGSLCFALASLLAGAFLIRALSGRPRPGLGTWSLAVAAILLGLAPFVAREILIDSCLDRGGRWNASLIECEQ